MKDFVIENIEELRRREGIVDRELMADIGRLQPGQSVKLSFATGPNGFETVTVCLTSANKNSLRGRLVKKPKATSLRSLDAGSLITFRPAHVHSIVGRSNSAECIGSATSAPTRSELLREARMEADRECDRVHPLLQLATSAAARDAADRASARALARTAAAVAAVGKAPARKGVSKNLRNSP